jgi:predicted Zn-dependent protease
MKQMMRKIFIIIFLFVFSYTCCFPRTTVEDRRFKAGLIIASKIEEDFPVSKKEEEFLRVSEIGLRIVSQIKDLKYPYSFAVLDVEDANAFALPGGFVYVTTGLLDLGLEDSELAFVIAHEIAHIEFDHIFKQKKKANLLSALMIGVEIFAMSHTSPSKDAREIRAESAARSLAYSLSGAMITSGYSREHEREADYWGRVYMTKAGYEIKGSTTALEKIDIMKRRRPDLFSSLLMTHPYILDRVEEAGKPTLDFEKDELIEIKTQKAGNSIQSHLIEEASFYENKDKEKLALLLYRNAYFLYPLGKEGNQALYKLLQNREELERKKSKFLVNWNFLIKNYSRILTEHPDTPLKEEVSSKLEQLKKERDEVYSWYKEKILQEDDGGQVGTDMSLEYYYNFVGLFPESPLVPKARYFLAKKYISANEYDKALNEFITLVKDSPENDLPQNIRQAGWGSKAKEEIIPVVGESTDIVLLGRLLGMDISDETKDKVNARLKDVIPEVKELQKLDEFSKEFPDSPYKDMVEKRKEKLAEELYVEARAQELTDNWAKTVHIYRQILKYAPDTSTAEQIRQDFERLEQIRKSEQ